MSNKLEKFATPHDELMALAGKAAPGEWEAGGDSDPTAILAREGWAQVAMTNDALPEAGDNAAFIAAACNFVRSDAFRAMVRDARRYQVLRQWFISGDPRYEVAPAGRLKMPTNADIDAWADAAIDAVASGAGEG